MRLWHKCTTEQYISSEHSEGCISSTSVASQHTFFTFAAALPFYAQRSRYLPISRRPSLTGSPTPELLAIVNVSASSVANFSTVAAETVCTPSSWTAMKARLVPAGIQYYNGERNSHNMPGHFLDHEREPLLVLARI